MINLPVSQSRVKDAGEEAPAMHHCFAVSSLTHLATLALSFWPKLISAFTWHFSRQSVTQSCTPGHLIATDQRMRSSIFLVMELFDESVPTHQKSHLSLSLSLLFLFLSFSLSPSLPFRNMKFLSLIASLPLSPGHAGSQKRSKQIHQKLKRVATCY